jgi:SAM-dependent methyltransferase
VTRNLLNLVGRGALRADAPATVDRLMAGPSPAQIAEALRAGSCPADRVFDRYLAYELRVVSGHYWTPLAVATRVAQWLDELDVRTVVDVGSGAGKFCIAAALAGRCRFTGLEQRPRLVSAARDLARLFEVEDRVSFVEAAFGCARSPHADAYYFYNPFGENMFGQSDHLDEDVVLSAERYRGDVAATEDFLRDVPVGTYLVTYNGFGGRVPDSYDEVRVDRDPLDVLRMWRKARSIDGGGFCFTEEL